MSKNKHRLHWFASEVLGTFILVLFGCGSVATAVSLGAPVGLFQVAISSGVSGWPWRSPSPDPTAAPT